jgi:hypothetical protein
MPVRAFRVKLPSTERYWTVVDDEYRIVRDVDEYLRHLRFGQDVAESTTTAYAASLALYLRWCVRTERDWRTAAERLGAFVTWRSVRRDHPAGRRPVGPRQTAPKNHRSKSQPDVVASQHIWSEGESMSLAMLDWGNVPAWTGSILTGSSLLIAALAYRRSVRDKERDQANKTVAWISMAPGDGVGDEESKSLATNVFVRNGSDLPIRHVTVWLSWPHGKATGREHWDTIIGDTTVRRENNDYDWDDNPMVQFKDAAGRWWHRSEDSLLHQGRSSEWPPEPKSENPFDMGPKPDHYR